MVECQNFQQKVAEMIERAAEINAENDRLGGKEREVEKENARHLKEREQLEKERFVEDTGCFFFHWASP